MKYCAFIFVLATFISGCSISNLGMTTRTWDWKLESAQLVGTNFYCLAKKETMVDLFPKPYHSDTHWSSEPTEHALLRYPLHQTSKPLKPNWILPLGKYQYSSHDFYLLPGATNMMVRLEDQKTYQVAYQCWWWSQSDTNIHKSQQIHEPKIRVNPRSIWSETYLGAGKDRALFLISNKVVCVELPNLTEDKTSRAAKHVQEVFNSIGTNENNGRQAIAGDLEWYVFEKKHSKICKTIAVNLAEETLTQRESKDYPDGKWAFREANVLGGELYYLYSRYLPGEASEVYSVVSQNRLEKKSLKLQRHNFLSWSIGSSQIVFEMAVGNKNRQKNLVFWDFKTEKNSMTTIEIPKTLSP